MESFEGKLAVVTGGGTGMGRELCLQLAAAGANIATCDVDPAAMAETVSLAREVAPKTVISTHECDVSDEAAMLRFRDEVIEAHDADHIDLLFNNAGIGGGGSFIEDDRADWERTFGVCWYGVYYGCRAFVPLLVKSEEGALINTSSVNGFWATLGPSTAHTAYSAAKFAVKGFTEALVNDFRLHAPQVQVALVMPGHVGTSIALNSSRVLGHGSALELSADDVARARERMIKAGAPVSNLTDDQIRGLLHQRAIEFRDNAPLSAAGAADIILSGVKAGRWRILVGDDAHHLDQMVRNDPEAAYEPDFVERLTGAGHLEALTRARAEAASEK
jgi:NAD(P)-dependent dehydrogenase (short-subunit alcohol dehydrogenase family)